MSRPPGDCHHCRRAIPRGATLCATCAIRDYYAHAHRWVRLARRGQADKDIALGEVEVCRAEVRELRRGAA